MKPKLGQLDEAIAIWERDVMSAVPKTCGPHMMPQEVRSKHGEQFFTILDKIMKRRPSRAGLRHK